MASLALSGIGASLALTATPVAASLSIAFSSGTIAAGVVTLIASRRKSAAQSRQRDKPLINADSCAGVATTYGLELVQEAEEGYIHRLMEMQAEASAMNLSAFSASDGDSTLDTEDSVIQKNQSVNTTNLLRKRLEFTEAEHAAALELNLRLQAKNDELEEIARHRQTDGELLLHTLHKQLDTLSNNTELRLQN